VTASTAQRSDLPTLKPERGKGKVKIFPTRGPDDNTNSENKGGRGKGGEAGACVCVCGGSCVCAWVDSGFSLGPFSVPVQGLEFDVRAACGHTLDWRIEHILASGNPLL
jgi:hypothetical protein